MSFDLTRRSLIVGMGAVSLLGMSPVRSAMAASGVLRLRNVASGERLAIRPSSQSDVLAISWLLRDVKDGGAGVWIDTRLIEMLVRLNVLADQINGRSNEIAINSAYRTKARNATIEGAAKASLHPLGKAVDYTIAGFENEACAKMSAMIGAGGIGAYSRFTHMDSGSDRTWIVRRL